MIKIRRTTKDVIEVDTSSEVVDMIEDHVVNIIR